MRILFLKPHRRTSDIRRRHKATRHADDMLGEPAYCTDGSLNAALFLSTLRHAVHEHLMRTRRPQDVATLSRAVDSYLMHLCATPPSANGQSAVTGKKTTGPERQERNRRYQRHTRARRVLSEIDGDDP